MVKSQEIKGTYYGEEIASNSNMRIFYVAPTFAAEDPRTTEPRAHGIIEAKDDLPRRSSYSDTGSLLPVI
ncbi:unnamed protein product [Heligmosomoides polygyrus]|uniref:Uncharacterized protein n=1 Tax=Heligmosomoides polygyrus TaxID=6339 RepID=A0A183GX63_HELPZ|nr:unnamed protein product [Heligmosomoides polygyrus]